MISEIPEDQIAKHIANDSNVERYENVEYVAVYTMAEYSDIFKCENAINSEDVSYQTVQSFMDFLSINENQCDIICAKTVHQGNSKFWFNQRTGRITVCHMKETTDKTNIVKLLMNYCLMEHIPEQLEWGHQKEIAAKELYFKKPSFEHLELTVAASGLVFNQTWPFLGASQDRIHSCNCHGKTLVECKSLFSKRNLLPGIAPSENLIKTTKGFQVTEKTYWYYQIQGQIAITGIHHTDLVIYTNKSSWLSQ